MGANTEISAPSDLGGQDFAISIDAAPADASYQDTVAGAGQNQNGMRQVDRVLAAAGVQVTYDGLGGQPRLAVATSDMRGSYAAGSTVIHLGAARATIPRDRAFRCISRRRRANCLPKIAVPPIAPRFGTRLIGLAPFERCR
ncbi:MAG: hypothetical protein U5N55_13875 [Cypionkella sp.]|nr:hypothetical protein [Cypionkella sp.]